VSFGARLAAAVAARGPLCVGVDPHAALLRDWGVGDDPVGLERFARGVVEAVGDRVAVLKPQSAFFERFGSRGIAVLERTLADIRAAGALALLDVKRGDIGSTNEAYAAAYLDPAGPLAADAITASPYLGLGSLRPLFAQAAAGGTGVFVLALTSNPDGPSVQGAHGPDGRPVAVRIAAGVRELNAAGPAGSYGLVVGATVAGPEAAALAPLLAAVGGPILAPGLGAQGGTVADLGRVFGAALPAVLPAVSREVLRRGPDRASLRAATDGYASQLADLLGAAATAR
jgi:orotidine-5'-phosphate decarboxylase